MSSFDTIPAAVFAGLSVAFGLRTIVRPWRPLRPRVDAWTLPSRRRMDPEAALAGERVDAASPIGDVLGVIGRSLATGLRSALGHRDEAALRLALDRAGLHDVDPEAYTLQQMAYAVGGLVAGGFLGGTASPRLGLVCAVLGLTLGMLLKQSELSRRTRVRCQRIRAELISLSSILAVHARATPNLQTVLARVVSRSHGEVPGELRRALAAIAAGSSAADALAMIAELTPEPAAARLYRSLALAAGSGSDIADALLRQSADLRADHRDARRAQGAKRRLVMTGTTVAFMVPPMVLFVAAPIPTLVSGQ